MKGWGVKDGGGRGGRGGEEGEGGEGMGGEGDEEGERGGEEVVRGERRYEGEGGGV